VGIAACFRFVQEHHRGPSPLSTKLSLLLPMRAIFPDEVVVWLELLPRGVSLTLHAFTIRVRSIERNADSQVHVGNNRVCVVHPARLTRAVLLVWQALERLRRRPSFLDQCYELIAFP
jgi:hypothetical protein